jgi:hypothetical protein
MYVIREGRWVPVDEADATDEDLEQEIVFSLDATDSETLDLANTAKELLKRYKVLKEQVKQANVPRRIRQHAV